MCSQLVTNNACVVPVAAHDAMAWAAGKLNDLDLLTLAPLVPEAVFIVDLPDRKNYRQILRLVKHWRQQGAFFLIARTGTPVVDWHLAQKNGCIRGCREDTDPVKYRFICSPEAFDRWCNKWGARSYRPLLKDAPTVKPEPLLLGK